VYSSSRTAFDIRGTAHAGSGRYIRTETATMEPRHSFLPIVNDIYYIKSHRVTHVSIRPMWSVRMEDWLCIGIWLV